MSANSDDWAPLPTGSCPYCGCTRPPFPYQWGPEVYHTTLICDNQSCPSHDEQDEDEE